MAAEPWPRDDTETELVLRVRDVPVVDEVDFFDIIMGSPV